MGFSRCGYQSQPKMLNTFPESSAELSGGTSGAVLGAGLPAWGGGEGLVLGLATVSAALLTTPGLSGAWSMLAFSAVWPVAGVSVFIYRRYSTRNG